jgi:hypothetical protein
MPVVSLTAVCVRRVMLIYLVVQQLSAVELLVSVYVVATPPREDRVLIDI